MAALGLPPPARHSWRHASAPVRSPYRPRHRPAHRFAPAASLPGCAHCHASSATARLMPGRASPVAVTCGMLGWQWRCWGAQAQSASLAGHHRITIHSSRTCFAGRLNSGVIRCCVTALVRPPSARSSQRSASAPVRSPRRPRHRSVQRSARAASLPSCVPCHASSAAVRLMPGRASPAAATCGMLGWQWRCWGAQAQLASLAGHHRITIHSSRTCFAGRLNSSVRPHGTIAQFCNPDRTCRVCSWPAHGIGLLRDISIHI